jgi:Mo25-like
MFGFGKKDAKPASLAKGARDAVAVFEKGTTNAKSLDKANDELLKDVSTLREQLVAAGDDQDAVAMVAHEVLSGDLLTALICNLHFFDLEVKKEVTLFFGQLCRKTDKATDSAVDYVRLY